MQGWRFPQRGIASESKHLGVEEVGEEVEGEEETSDVP